VIIIYILLKFINANSLNIVFVKVKNKFLSFIEYIFDNDNPWYLRLLGIIIIFGALTAIIWSFGIAYSKIKAEANNEASPQQDPTEEIKDQNENTITIQKNTIYNTYYTTFIALFSCIIISMGLSWLDISCEMKRLKEFATRPIPRANTNTYETYFDSLPFDRDNWWTLVIDAIYPWINGLFNLSLFTVFILLIVFIVIFTVIAPQLVLLIIIIQRLLVSKIFGSTDEDKQQGWDGWSLPFLPLYILLLFYDENKLNSIINIINFNGTLNIL
jgi:hypothetical protein